MEDFEYAGVSTLDEAISVLSSGKAACIISGGTDLLVQLREGRKHTQIVVDIKKIPEVNELTYSARQGLWIGAAVPCSRIVSDPITRNFFPGLVDAISIIGGTQIQNRASVGGNLCNASPAADSIPALIAHQATAVVAGVKGRFEIPVKDFCIGPGKSMLGPAEILVAIRVPPVKPGFGAAYLRFTPRNEMDIAVAGSGASVILDRSGTRFQSVCLALGAVGPTPILVEDINQLMNGNLISPEVIHQGANLAQQAARPISDMRGTVEQRKHLAFVLSQRAINMAIERARLTMAGGSGF